VYWLSACQTASFGIWNGMDRGLPE
jgi:hypothetical protein